MKQFDTVEKALDELKQGHLILVTDDEDRENEGDMILSARQVLPRQKMSISWRRMRRA